MIQITLYSQPACRPCKVTATILTAAGAEFTKTDVVEHPADGEYVRRLGATQSPVVVAHQDGAVLEWWDGFRPDRAKALAALQKESQ